MCGSRKVCKFVEDMTRIEQIGLAEGVVAPASLRQGDLVWIVSPASAVDPMLVEGAANALQRTGLRVRIAPHAACRRGTYSGTAEERIADFRAALADEGVRALLCSRGGYGAVHLLGNVEPRPVWLIGFSDMSALHALWQSRGIASIHGSMAKHLAQFPADDAANAAMMQILTTGQMAPMQWEWHPLNRAGTATGKIAGGNLAVLAQLIDTPVNLLLKDSILVIEDIAEPIYKVERIMHQLRLSGVLKSLRGLIVGQFTDYRPDSNHESMEQMIAELTAGYDYPVAMNAPIGHIDGNMPWIEGAQVTLHVKEQ